MCGVEVKAAGVDYVDLEWQMVQFCAWEKGIRFQLDCILER